ncbi:MAG: hypothetical protein ACFFBD_10735 [Candidatus Hodarchaeota archaeon]
MLKYLLISNDIGLPLYSKCFSGFCKTAFEEPLLLSGLLTAIESFTQEISRGEALESVKMGQTTMFLKKTLPSGHSVVIGLEKETPKIAESIFKAIETILETDYKDLDPHLVDTDIAEEFEQKLLKQVLVPTLHDHNFTFQDECPMGDQCPMRTLASDAKKGTIWSTIKGTFTRIRARMKR